MVLPGYFYETEACLAAVSWPCSPVWNGRLANTIHTVLRQNMPAKVDEDLKQIPIYLFKFSLSKICKKSYKKSKTSR